ncbi:hypothetical protein TWF281_002990 [Arthrobotrys megalospora]
MLLKRTVVFGLSLVETATAIALRNRAVCHADYCLRALRASQIPTRLPQASADCSSLLALINGEQHVTATVTEETTVTASTTITLGVTAIANFTITQTTTVAEETITLTLPIPGPGTVKKRQVATIPGYASWCSGTVRFTSACACIGVTSASPALTSSHTETVLATITVPVTETVYTTTTATTTFGATATANSDEVVKSVYKFKIRGEGGGNTVYLSVTGPGTIDVVDDITEATSFSLSTTSGPLMVEGMQVLIAGDGTALAYLNIDDPNDVGPSYHPLQCNLGAANRVQCDYFGSNVFGESSGFLVLGPAEGLAEIDLALTAFAG